MRTRMMLAAALATGFACGGGGGPAPTPVPSVTAPVIGTSNTMIYVGQSITFTASGGGTIRWGGDAPTIATVDAVTGKVSGVGIGRVTIWAENEGGRTTRLLRGLPSFAGTWGGTYVVDVCQASGEIADIGFCDIFPPGEPLEIALGMSQTDDRVTGTFTLGVLAPGTLNSSTVAESGQLPLTGTYSSSDGVTIRLENARLDSATPGTVTGSFDQRWSATGASGVAILACSIRSLTRTSGGPALFQRPGSEHISLNEAIRRVLRK